MKKYKVSHSTYRSEHIEEVEVLRETAQCVFVMGWGGEVREAKSSSIQRYFDTWDEAHEYALDRANKKVEYAEQRLESERSRLEEIRALKRPQ